MSIERGLHRRWSATGLLTRLVPPQRVTTGAHPDGVLLPYLVIERVGPGHVTRTSSQARLIDTVIRFRIYASGLDAAKRIASGVLSSFARCDFGTPGGRILDMKPLGQNEERREDGSWLVALDFSVKAVHRKEV